MKHFLFIFFCLYLLFLPACLGNAPDSVALEMLARFEETHPQKSEYFENINPQNYIDNIRRRLYEPEKFCQGFGSQFCGPSILIVNLLLLRNQKAYTQLMIDLFRHGKAVYYNGKDSVLLSPDAQTRSFAGRIYDGEKKSETEYREMKGQQYVTHSELLSDNQADQVLLLSLKHRYPGLIGSGSFKKGALSKRLHFASTLFKQLKVIARDFFHANFTAKGGAIHDMRPSDRRTMTEITEACKAGKTLFLMVDAGYFRESRELLLWGSHYIRIFDLQVHKKTIDFEMWDYGYRRWVKGYSKARFISAVTGYLIIES
ncbi:MAG: hypothetical protein LBF39_05470 [Prevotellaceae bacterium]|jgi:hypothetical protein|nr:hypothetical protein [Prevotellaceae bacterium]